MKPKEQQKPAAGADTKDSNGSTAAVVEVAGPPQSGTTAESQQPTKFLTESQDAEVREPETLSESSYTDHGLEEEVEDYSSESEPTSAETPSLPIPALLLPAEHDLKEGTTVGSSSALDVIRKRVARKRAVRANASRSPNSLSRHLHRRASPRRAARVLAWVSPRSASGLSPRTSARIDSLSQAETPGTSGPLYQRRERDLYLLGPPDMYVSQGPVRSTPRLDDSSMPSADVGTWRRVMASAHANVMASAAAKAAATSACFPVTSASSSAAAASAPSSPYLQSFEKFRKGFQRSLPAVYRAALAAAARSGGSSRDIAPVPQHLLREAMASPPHGDFRPFSAFQSLSPGPATPSTSRRPHVAHPPASAPTAPVTRPQSAIPFPPGTPLFSWSKLRATQNSRPSTRGTSTPRSPRSTGTSSKRKTIDGSPIVFPPHVLHSPYASVTVPAAVSTPSPARLPPTRSAMAVPSASTSASLTPALPAGRASAWTSDAVAAAAAAPVLSPSRPATPLGQSGRSVSDSPRRRRAASHPPRPPFTATQA